MLDDDRLIGDQMNADADRQVGNDLRHLLLQRLAEVKQVCAGLHADGKPDCRLAVVPEQGLGRIGITARDGRDVSQRKEAVVDTEIDRVQACLRREPAVHPHADPLGPLLEHPGRRDRVLSLQGGHDRVDVEAKGRDLPGGEFEVDHLVLRSQNVDLTHIRHGQDLGADTLDLVAQLTLGQAVAGEGIDVTEHVAEAIVEARPDHPLREFALDIRDHVADADPGRLDVSRLCRVSQIDEYGGLARDRHALGVVEQFQLLELLFDPVGDLARHLFGRCARPLRLDHHGLDGEVGIFLTTKLKVGKEACRHEGDHEIPDERTMAERPVGKVERLHGF